MLQFQKGGGGRGTPRRRGVPYREFGCARDEKGERKTGAKGKRQFFFFQRGGGKGKNGGNGRGERGRGVALDAKSGLMESAITCLRRKKERKQSGYRSFATFRYKAGDGSESRKVASSATKIDIVRRRAPASSRCGPTKPLKEEDARVRRVCLSISV